MCQQLPSPSRYHNKTVARNNLFSPDPEFPPLQNEFLQFSVDNPPIFVDNSWITLWITGDNSAWMVDNWRITPDYSKSELELSSISGESYPHIHIASRGEAFDFRRQIRYTLCTPIFERPIHRPCRLVVASPCRTDVRISSALCVIIFLPRTKFQRKQRELWLVAGCSARFLRAGRIHRSLSDAYWPGPIRSLGKAVMSRTNF
jgi:hypothetical protein